MDGTKDVHYTWLVLIHGAHYTWENTVYKENLISWEYVIREGRSI